MIIDSGLSTESFRSLLDMSHHLIDFVKFGWGSSIVSSNLKEKISLLKHYSVDFWFGGTLFELAFLQSKLDRYFNYLDSLDCQFIEISDGTIDINLDRKLELIADCSSKYTVLSEIGSKDSTDVMSPSQWIHQIKSETEAGSWKIIAEGRESGNVGIYRNTGEVRVGLIKDLQVAGIDFSRIIFEAPEKSQQVWFIKTLGVNCNLGNISPSDILKLETLRLGLRSDTLTHIHNQYL